MCQDRRIFEIFFPPKCLPRWSHEESGCRSQSRGTQFLIFLLLPGLSRLRTVNGTKQKQERGARAVPHKRQREGEEERKERCHFLRFISREQRINHQFCTKTWQQSQGHPRASPLPMPSPSPCLNCPQNEDKTKKPQTLGKNYEKSGEAFPPLLPLTDPQVCGGRAVFMAVGGGGLEGGCSKFSVWQQ